MVMIYLDLSIYKENSIRKTVKEFSKYISIDLEKKDEVISLTFKGLDSEIYSKEFCNYLILNQNKGI